MLLSFCECVVKCVCSWCRENDAGKTMPGNEMPGKRWQRTVSSDNEGRRPLSVFVEFTWNNPNAYLFPQPFWLKQQTRSRSGSIGIRKFLELALSMSDWTFVPVVDQPTHDRAEAVSKKAEVVSGEPTVTISAPEGRHVAEITVRFEGGASEGKGKDVEADDGEDNENKDQHVFYRTPHSGRKMNAKKLHADLKCHYISKYSTEELLQEKVDLDCIASAKKRFCQSSACLNRIMALKCGWRSEHKGAFSQLRTVVHAGC